MTISNEWPVLTMESAGQNNSVSLRPLKGPIGSSTVSMKLISFDDLPVRSYRVYGHEMGRIPPVFNAWKSASFSDLLSLG
jgi:hypothetical protein